MSGGGEDRVGKDQGGKDLESYVTCMVCVVITSMFTRQLATQVRLYSTTCVTEHYAYEILMNVYQINEKKYTCELSLRYNRSIPGNFSY